MVRFAIIGSPIKQIY